MDERLYGDTIFRAEKVDENYVISDIWLYNSNCIFMASTFKQRYEWLSMLLPRFHNPIFTKLIHKSQMTNIPIRGYEVYSDKIGDYGCFEEDRKTVVSTSIPDVYTVEGSEGYLLVPTLKISEYLRSKGETFQLKCGLRDGNWEVLEDIP